MDSEKNRKQAVMNPNWKNYLSSYKATFHSETEITFPSVTDNNSKSITLSLNSLFFQYLETMPPRFYRAR